MKAPSTSPAVEGAPRPRSNPRLRRTLLGAAIGALLAMSIVPYATHTDIYHYRRGYIPIYEVAGQESVNVAQLAVNISFAALAAALAFNLSRRAIFWTTATIGVCVVAGVGLPAYHELMRAGAEREEAVAHNALLSDNFDLAKQRLLRASNYWWWKGWWEEARRVSERAFDEQAMKQEAAAYLHFTPRWLDEQTRPGMAPIVPFLLIGGEKRFRKCSLDRELERREIKRPEVRL